VLPEPTQANLTEEEFENTFNTQIEQVANGTGLTVARVRELWFEGTKAFMLRTRLLEEVDLGLEETRPTTHVAHILIRPIYEAVAEDESPDAELAVSPTPGLAPTPTTEETEAAFARALERIQEIYDRIQAGEEFEALAAEFSEDPSNAYKGGDLGWSASGRFVEEFDTVAQSLPVGEISEPVRTQFGWHLIKIYDRQTEQIPEFELDFTQQQEFQTLLTSWREESGTETGDAWLDFIPSLP
jgi:hypothetical protein